MSRSHLRGWVAVAIVCGFLPPCYASHASGPLRITEDAGSQSISIVGAGEGRHTLEIDDAVNFRVPVFARTFQGDSVVLHTREAGLIPGIRYWMRVDRRAAVDLRLSPGTVIERRGLNCELLQSSWQETGRFRAGVADSRLQWEDNPRGWEPIPPAAPIGQALYSVELVLRPALNAARACNDRGTLDEIALYYTAMLDKSRTIESLLSMPNLTPESRERMSGSNPKARTIPARFDPGEIGEGELFNSQWLYPAALLTRLISQLPEAERTPGMQVFLSRFTPFLVQDQLLRFLFDQPMAPLGGRLHRGRVARWKLAMQGLQGEKHWDAAMSDIDIWLLASTADLLGAHANDPENVKVTAEEVTRLKQALRVGVCFFQSKRTLLADTRDFNGRVVGSASYFNGDYDGESEMRGSAVTGREIPENAVAFARKGASWDIGHMYRVAVFLRSLYENRKATDLQFPAYEDLRLVVNQYVYNVFNGDYQRPLFHNNFDGSDGWFRVGYNGSDFGQPPSPYCDMHNVKRLCMTPGSIVGWPELSFVNPDLARLQEALVRMAFDQAPQARAFADQYYFWSGPFAVVQSGTRAILGGAFYAIAAENAERFSVIGVPGQPESSSKISPGAQHHVAARPRATGPDRSDPCGPEGDGRSNQSGVFANPNNGGNADVRIRP